MEKLYFKMAVDTVEKKEDSIRIKWYASTPEIDKGNDVVPISAREKEIALKSYREHPDLLLQHKSDKYIGSVDVIEVKEKWLYVEAEVKYNVDNIFERIMNGDTKTLSIWYVPHEFHFETKQWVKLEDLESKELDHLESKNIIRMLDTLELVEISVVQNPMNDWALFSLGKSVKEFFDWIHEEEINKYKQVKSEQEVEEEEEEITTDDATDEVENTDDQADDVSGNDTDEGDDAGIDMEEDQQPEAEEVKQLDALKSELEELNKEIESKREELEDLAQKNEEIKQEIKSRPVNQVKMFKIPKTTTNVSKPVNFYKWTI